MRVNPDRFLGHLRLPLRHLTGPLEATKNMAGPLQRYPFYVCLTWSVVGTATLLGFGGESLKTIVLVVGLVISWLGVLVATIPFLNAMFWTMNILQGFMQPVMFRVLDHVVKTAPEGDASAVVRAIDEQCWSGDFCMNVGDVKGKILDQAILDAPKKGTVVELGAHIGYSTVRIASNLPKSSRLYSVDPEPMGLAIKSAFLAHARISRDQVVSVYDYSQNFLKQMADRGEKIDVMFIDHVKGLYLSDLKLALDLGLFQKGSVIVADNVLFPGAPDYKAFVLEDPRFDTVVHDTLLEYSKTAKDEVLVSHFKG